MGPLVKLEELYDPCSIATIGHDWPQGQPQKQMKILAGQQGAPIFLCMIQKIVGNVRSRLYPDNPLALTGPMVLHDCSEEQLLAFEVPHHDGTHNYKIDFDLHEVYRPTCGLRGSAVAPVHPSYKQVLAPVPNIYTWCRLCP